jgi:hypothetical protein
MINPTPRPPLSGRVKFITLSVIAGLGLISFGPVQAQTSASLCLAITTSVNGVAVTSCVPVSATNPMPIIQSGTATATLTAGTTPTSGFGAGSFLMSTGSVIQAGPVGVSCAAASVSLTTFVVTNGIVTHC